MSERPNPLDKVWFMPALLGVGTPVAIIIGGVAGGFEPRFLVPMALIAGVLVAAGVAAVFVQQERSMRRELGSDAGRQRDRGELTRSVLKGQMPAGRQERERALSIMRYWSRRHGKVRSLMIIVTVVLPPVSLVNVFLSGFQWLAVLQLLGFSFVLASYWSQGRRYRRRIGELESVLRDRPAPDGGPPGFSPG